MKRKMSKKHTFNYFLDVTCNAFINFTNWINKILNDKKKRTITKTIIRFGCCLVLIAILEIPFIIVGKTVEGILYLCNFTFNNEILHGWNYLVEYAYLIFALILLLNTIIDMSKKKEYSFKLNNSLQSGKNLYYAIVKILKIIIIVLLIPLVLVGIILFVLLGMLISLITHGIYILGPILIIIGLLIIICVVLLYLYDILFDEEGGKK